jgi:hypothetical protein
MRKANVLEFVSLDGVIQAPGGPEEDTSGGFAYGEWISPHSEPVVSTKVLGTLKDKRKRLAQSGVSVE